MPGADGPAWRRGGLPRPRLWGGGPGLAFAAPPLLIGCGEERRREGGVPLKVMVQPVCPGGSPRWTYWAGQLPVALREAGAHQEGPGPQSWVSGALGGSRPRQSSLQSRLFAPLLRDGFSQRSPCECRTAGSPSSGATGDGGAGVNLGAPSEGSGTAPLLSARRLEPGEGALAGASVDRVWQRPG